MHFCAVIAYRCTLLPAPPLSHRQQSAIAAAAAEAAAVTSSNCGLWIICAHDLTTRLYIDAKRFQ